MTETAPKRSPWRILRLRVASRTLTLDEYRTEVEPHLTRPLTDDPIRRRVLRQRAAPREPVR
jgi:hypothetical protein